MTCKEVKAIILEQSQSKHGLELLKNSGYTLSERENLIEILKVYCETPEEETLHDKYWGRDIFSNLFALGVGKPVYHIYSHDFSSSNVSVIKYFATPEKAEFNTSSNNNLMYFAQSLIFDEV